MFLFVKNFFKADMRQKNLMFWDWIFPVLLMVGASVFISGNENKTGILGGLIAFLMLQSFIYSIPYRISQYRQSGILRTVVEEGSVMKFTLAFLLTRILIVFVQVVIFLVIGILLTGAEVDMNIPYFLCAIILGMMSLGGFSLFVGTLAKSDQAALGFSQLFYLLFTAISGIFFPIEKSPELLRWISIISPVTYLNRAIGNSLSSGDIDLYGMVFMLVFGIVFMILSTVLYRKILYQSKSSNTVFKPEYKW